MAAGRAESLSAWVNAALRRQADHDQRVRALSAFIEEYEAEHGVITDEEVVAASRHLRGRARVVRARPPMGAGDDSGPADAAALL